MQRPDDPAKTAHQPLMASHLTGVKSNILTTGLINAICTICIVSLLNGHMVALCFLSTTVPSPYPTITECGYVTRSVQ